MNRTRMSSIVLLAVLAMLIQSGARAETVLSLEGSGKNSACYQAFVEKHPDVTVNTVSNIYYSTYDMISAFITGEMRYDTFNMTSGSFDIKQLMRKGYCAPLSDSQVISEALSRMYEPIRAMVTEDNHIYGVPFFCYIGYYTYSPEAWEAAGLSVEEVPSSFGAYLDFLEQWVNRIRENPEYDISVCNAFDETQYDEHSYVSYLVDRLIQEHIMQSSYAHEPLRFDTPEIRELLDRCQRIGADLYRYEPKTKGNLALFEDLHGMRYLEYLVPLRITEEQPILVKANLTVSFLNVRSTEQDLAKAYLECCATCITPEDAAYLYPDAQPVENEAFATIVDSTRQMVTSLEMMLTDETLTPEARIKLEDRLAQKKEQLMEMENAEERYFISPQDLERYHTYGSYLYFQAPSIFDPSTSDGENMKRLRDRFSYGNLPLDQFVAELDRLAWMLETE